MTLIIQFLVIASCVLAVLVGGPGCIWILRRDLRRGETTWPRKYSADLHYNRYKSPFLFWVCIVVYAVTGLMMFIVGCWFLIDAIRKILG